MKTAPPAPTDRRLLWLVLALALTLPVLLLIRNAWRSPRAAAGSLGDYGVVPDASLVERSGRRMRIADLAGTPWVADFVYTHCSGTCPLLSAEMARLRHRVGQGVRLVSFSVDPARDTPEVLAAYAQRFGAPRDGWLFFTGDVSELRRLISRGFHLAVADPPPGDATLAGTITHSEKIVLVDRELHIRRYYDGGSDDWIGAAVADLERLGAAPSSS
jgi:cytochrome oxidase Cu insertion factor (SCO1/SenC/PrrC family)